MNLILAKAFFPLAIALLLAVAACGADSQYEAAPLQPPQRPAPRRPMRWSRLRES